MLRRGAQDQGVIVQPNLLGTFPHISRVMPPQNQPAALLGDSTNNLAADALAVLGNNLNGTHLEIRLAHANLAASYVISSGYTVLPNGLSVTLPTFPFAQTTLPAGIYTVAVARTDLADPAVPGQAVQTRVTGSVPFSIAPRIVVGDVDGKRHHRPDDTGGFVQPSGVADSACLPAARGSRSLRIRRCCQRPSRAGSSGSFSTPAAGPYLVRLRVGGVDSLVVKYGTTPTFDPAMQVTITRGHQADDKSGPRRTSAT